MSRLLHFAPRESTRARFILATIGLGFGPSLYLIGELFYHQVSLLPILGATLACFGLYLWIAGILGKVHLLRTNADRLGLVGGCIALLGLVAVSNIMLLQLVLVLIERKAENYPFVIAGVFRNVLFVTYVFGPVFPLGLFLLGIGLHRLKVFPFSATGVFLLGTIGFPTGRIADLPLLIHLSDLMIALGSIEIAWHLWKQPELWMKSSGD